jgi:microcystin degradation protein MlrC
MRMRVAIGGISHETNTFSSLRTDLSAFQRRALLRGAALLSGSRGVGNALGGMVDTATALGWELVPTIFASAIPAGRVRRGTFETLANELASSLGAAVRNGGLDGVLLALHGAMVTEALDDADGEILRRVRRAIGPAVPVICVLDMHANLTPLMAEQASILLAYETYPHVDTYARGCEAVTLLERLHRREFHPVHVLRQVPLLAPLPSQWTGGATPMRDLTRFAARLRQTPGTIAMTVTGGFPYSDIYDAGMAVLVTTDDDPVDAARLADRLARACWERRDDFQPELTSIPDAIALARHARQGPLVLADVADNPGAGGSGDGTALLEALLAARVPGAAVGVIADPEAVARATALGVDGQEVLALGGKIDHLHGPTLNVRARVRWLGEVRFANSGPMGAGGITRLGRTVLLEVTLPGAEDAPPVEVIVTEHRAQVLDPALFRAAGIEPEQRRVLVVKSSVHFRAAFEALVADIVAVDGPGLSSPDLASFPYRKVRRPIWPLDDVGERA